MSFRLQAVARLGAWVLCLGLAACGGGGGGDSGGGGGVVTPPTTFNLSGTISIAETAAVDTDTNDINQTGYVPNDTATTAQALDTPVLLVGSVNEPNTGPRGNNNNGTATLGDVDDWFRIDLVAGQVVELEFASDPAASDVDLYVFSADGATIGASEGVDTRFECVAVTRSTTYFVVVSAYSKASIYNMRIGAPGSAANCAQQAASLPFVKGELIAEPLRAGQGAAEKADALVRAARASIGTGLGVSAGTSAQAQAPGLRAHAGPQLLHLPRSDADRREGLQALVRWPPARRGRGPACSLPMAWPAATSRPPSPGRKRWRRCALPSGCAAAVPSNTSNPTA
jgi:hypothetical protein